MTAQGSTAVAARPVGEPSGEPEPMGADQRVAGRLPELTLVLALGVALLAYTYHLGRDGQPVSPSLYWIALVLLFVPAAWRVTAARASSVERWGLVLLTAGGLYLVKALHSPIQPTFTDELQQLRSIDDLSRTGHLFEPNPLVGAYPSFPGLTITMNAFSELTGASSFVAGLVIIGTARLVLASALYLLLTRITGSARLAAVAGLLYMTNPNFVYFGAEVGYESFGLPLAVLALLVVSRLQGAGPGRRKAWWAGTVLLLGAVTVSHHMTTLWLLAVLAAWAVLGRRWGRPRPDVAAVSVSAGILAVLAGLWFSLVAGATTLDELAPVFRGAISASLGLLSGEGTGGKAPFRAPSGPPTPAWEQAIGFGSVLLLLVVLPWGLLRLWREHRASGAQLALGALALVYPVTLGLRLTQAGTEISSRSSEFVFFGLALVTALAWAPLGRRGADPGQHRFRRRRQQPATHLEQSSRPWTRRRRTGIAVASCFLLVGGVVVGWPPYARLPGPFLVEAASRSVEREGVQAALWARDALPPRSRVVTNGTNQQLFGGYGRLNPQGGQINGVSVPELFFATTFEPFPRRIIEENEIRYVVADLRLTEQPSRTGVYIQRGERGAYQRSEPLPRRTMTKFEGVPGLDRIFDSGNIVVYDASARLFPSTGIDP